jgi:hypothetical protein
MKFKSIITLFAVLLTSLLTAAEAQSKRPCELRFYVNYHLNTVTSISYNTNGDVIKMSSYENEKLTDYARYRYTTDKRLYSERTYSAAGIIIRTRSYIYNKSGQITGEKVYSPDGELTEYLVINWKDKKIQKIDYYKTDNNLFQTIEFKYNNGILEAMAFNKIGKYIMIMRAVYDKDMFLTGHNIIHSNADVKISTEYIYEDGYAANESLQVIFR